MHKLRHAILVALLVGAVVIGIQLATTTGAAEGSLLAAASSTAGSPLAPVRSATSSDEATAGTEPRRDPTSAQVEDASTIGSGTAPGTPPVPTSGLAAGAATAGPSPVATTVPPTTTPTTTTPVTAAPVGSASPTAAPVGSLAPSVAPSAAEAQVLALINAERAGAGLPALRLTAGAASVARAWTAHMAAHALDHNPNLVGDLAQAGVGDWRWIAENVGQGHSVDQVHAMLMGSPMHRANVLGIQFSQVGIGVATNGDQVFVTLDFLGW